MARKVCKEIRYDSVSIRTANNGFTVHVHEDGEHEEFVFRTFDEVVRWLKDNLVQPGK